MDNIGENIKFYRKMQGLSMQELANEIDMSLGAIQKYENGSVIPKKEVITKISNALNVPLGVLNGDIKLNTEFKILILLERKTLNNEMKWIELNADPNTKEKDDVIENIVAEEIKLKDKKDNEIYYTIDEVNHTFFIFVKLQDSIPFLITGKYEKDLKDSYKSKDKVLIPQNKENIDVLGNMLLSNLQLIRSKTKKTLTQNILSELLENLKNPLDED